MERSDYHRDWRKILKTLKEKKITMDQIASNINVIHLLEKRKVMKKILWSKGQAEGRSLIILSNNGSTVL